MFRVRSRCTAPLVFLLLALALVAPRSAAAQFGKLKKAAGQKAAETAVDKAVGSGKLAACMPDRPPTVVQSISLTPAQIAKLNAGLDAELAGHAAAQKAYEDRVKAADKENQAYERAHADYEKRYAQYSKCADKVHEADSKKMDSLNVRTQASGDELKGGVDQDQMTKMAEKAQAAAERVSQGRGTAEDRATLAEFQKMMAGVQAGGAKVGADMKEASDFQAGADARVEKACGKKPVEPKAPESLGQSPERAAQEAGAKAAGMDVQSYAMGRETLVGFVMANTVVQSGKSDGAGGGGHGSQSDADAANQALRDAAKKICDMRKAGVPI